MTPDPQMKAAGWFPTHELSVADARKAFKSRVAKGAPLPRSQDRTVPGPAGDIPVRSTGRVPPADHSPSREGDTWRLLDRRSCTLPGGRPRGLLTSAQVATWTVTLPPRLALE
jgi:hypothetical protein